MLNVVTRLMWKSEFQSRRAGYNGKANSEEPLFFKGVSFSKYIKDGVDKYLVLLIDGSLM